MFTNMILTLSYGFDDTQEKYPKGNLIPENERIAADALFNEYHAKDA